jgi:hypothetical protein
MRDPRFVAVHRGGSLPVAHHRLLAGWAADCAERALPWFAEQAPQDERPAQAIAAARAWACGEITVGAARNAAVAAHAAARAVPAGAARDAARATGHAAATVHMADHALGGAVYALKAIKFAADTDDGAITLTTERRWQEDRLPEEIRELVLSAIEGKMRLIR